MDICHKSHINQQSHKINKKQYYHETNLHYPLITEPTLNYPTIRMRQRDRQALLRQRFFH